MILIEASFTNVSNGATYNFLGSGCRVQKWEPTYTGRVVDRPRMQEHGSVPTTPYIEKLPLHVEGLLLGDTQEFMVTERDDFLRAMLGNLTRRKTVARSGTLTLEYEGWGTSATVDVATESAAAAFGKDGVRTCEFMVQFICFQPYALNGDTPFYI